MRYFIGDIHGHYSTLIELLHKLGYRKTANKWIHPKGAKITFTGDFVDTGTQNLAVVELIQELVECGIAEAIMGNHDFNIVAMFTPVTSGSVRYLRTRSTKNMNQSRTTMAEFLAEPDRALSALSFLVSLPLWIETEDYRTVHAFWNPDAMETLKPHLDDQHRLTKRGFKHAAARSGPIGDARAQLLSGPEIACEPYQDRYGNTRTMERHCWWQEAHSHSKPIFFGHYALNMPLQVHGKAICVDAGIALGRKIAAYRFVPGEPLSVENFIYAGASAPRD